MTSDHPLSSLSSLLKMIFKMLIITIVLHATIKHREDQQSDDDDKDDKDDKRTSGRKKGRERETISSFCSTGARVLRVLDQAKHPRYTEQVNSSRCIIQCPLLPPTVGLI